MSSKSPPPPVSLTPNVPIEVTKRKVKKNERGEKYIDYPFTVVVDSREQKRYHFDNLWSGPTGKSPRLKVNTVVCTLPTGDYSLAEFPRVCIERKSKEDLYSSISQKRENFEARLYNMCMNYDFAAVVVEADWQELLSNPPVHTNYSAKSLGRTIQAWKIRYCRVQWELVPNRQWAENMTFRLLEKFAQYSLAIHGGTCDHMCWEVPYDCMFNFSDEQLKECNND